MYYIIYTLREGGDYYVTRGITDEQTKHNFLVAKRNGYLPVTQNQGVETSIQPYFISLVEEKNNYDFILKRKR